MPEATIYPRCSTHTITNTRSYYCVLLTISDLLGEFYYYVAGYLSIRAQVAQFRVCSAFYWDLNPLLAPR